VGFWHGTGKLVTTLTNPNAAYVMGTAVAPDGSMVAVSSDGGPVYVWDTATRRITATLSKCRVKVHDMLDTLFSGVA
jgi:WD40 repeat protein